MNIHVKLLSEAAVMPTKAHATDAGWDLYASDDVFVSLNETSIISTGVSMFIPSGYFAKIEDRSSMGLSGLKVMGGVIDTAFIGELKVILTNLSCKEDRQYLTDDHENFIPYSQGKQILKGQKIAQVVIHKLPEISLVQTDELQEQGRGFKGLGSSGR